MVGGGVAAQVATSPVDVPTPPKWPGCIHWGGWPRSWSHGNKVGFLAGKLLGFKYVYRAASIEVGCWLAHDTNCTKCTNH